MRSLAPILASIVFALLLMAGLLVLQLEGPPMGASVGAAIAVAALAAFLLTYDLLKREGKAALPETGSGDRGGTGKGPVRPLFDPEDVVYIDAAARSGIEHINEMLKDRRRDVIYVFRIMLQPKNRYELQALTGQLAVLAQQIEPLPFVYFENPDRSFVAFANAETVFKLLKDPKGAGLLELINSGRDEALRDSFEELTHFIISRKLSNEEALGKMALKDAPLAMIVHERLERPIGPISWAVLVTRVLRRF